MKNGVTNEAGEQVFECSSDAEAAQWWLENGRRGDVLTDTGEEMEDVALQVLDVAIQGYERNGCVKA